MQNKLRDNLLADVFETPLGYAGCITGSGKVRRVLLPTDSKTTILEYFEGVEASLGHIEPVSTLLTDYLSGKNADFSNIQVELFTSDFAKAILLSLREIPYQSVSTYSELADIAGHKGKSRATGRVLATNPIPIILPCHRIIRLDGKIGGFMGDSDKGTSLKLKLLALEGFDISLLG